METRSAYPGTFGPPHRGHARIAERAAAVFPNLVIVCSSNPGKNGQWFSPEEAKALWKSYRLPPNVSVKTLDEFRAEGNASENIVMIRGIRGPEDVADEGKVLLYNREHFGISQFFYVVSEPDYAGCSSTAARKAAEALDFPALAAVVAPLVASAMLEKVLGARRLYLAVGRPGSGKSTVLRRLAAESPDVVHIETDRFLDGTKAMLVERFGTHDLVKVALERGEELKAAVAPLWFGRLAEELRKAPCGSRVFVEAAYALQPDKALYRHLGGRVICFDCGDAAENRNRIAGRGTPEHLPFAEMIPDAAESRKIAETNRLEFARVDTSAGIEATAASLDRMTKGE